VKKFVNNPEALTREAVEGFGAAHPDIVRVHPDPLYVARASGPAPGKVALISGGGSGHEPLHTGFVGFGMLDAAVPGAMFTSPTPDQILAATLGVNGGAGIVYIVKNYTGDVLNFELAAELAEMEGIEIQTVVVSDDVAVTDSLYTAGRRGVAGTVLVEKIAGAAAELGADLAAVTAIAERVSAGVRTMGVALTSCTVPHVGEPSFELAPDEIELGIGIHGEPGRQRIPIRSADEMTDLLLESVLTDLKPDSGSRLLLLVNGMGGTPLSELYVVFRRAAAQLSRRNFTVARSLVGNYTTSLEMQGCSITLLQLDDELVGLWDKPVQTAALRWGR
jgi:dihydroxyacetone kinase-like protein